MRTLIFAAALSLAACTDAAPPPETEGITYEYVTTDPGDRPDIDTLLLRHDVERLSALMVLDPSAAEREIQQNPRLGLALLREAAR